MNFSATSDYRGEGRHLQRSMTKQNISKLTFLPDDNVLDVGCGTGEETKSIAKKVWSVTGIDVSKEMVALARQNNSGPNITYDVGDALTCGENPNWRERFDKVACLYVLHWCRDHEKALRSILSCVKPGGEGLFVMGHRTPIHDKAASFLAGHPKWANYLKGYKLTLNLWSWTIDGTYDVFTACGWMNAQCEIQSFTSSSEVQTKLFFKTVFGQTALIPEAEQGAYLVDLWQWALSRYGDDTQSGHVRLPVEHMVVHASRPLRPSLGQACKPISSRAVPTDVESDR